MFRLLARRCPGTALVDVAHNPLPYDVNGKTESVEKGGRLTRSMLGAAYRACDLVLVLGEGPRSNLLAAFPELDRVAICGHGDYSSVLASEGVPPPSAAPANVLFFGAWTKYKNLPLLLDSFELVRRQLPDARLTIAGPVMPDVDLPVIAERAAAIGNVELRPGYVPMTELRDLFAGHRVVVFTYETVNISGSVHMAYTFGRPVVATDVGSMRDVVQPGVTGLLTANDARSIADAMVEILAIPPPPTGSAGPQPRRATGELRGRVSRSVRWPRTSGGSPRRRRAVHFCGAYASARVRRLGALSLRAAGPGTGCRTPGSGSVGPGPLGSRRTGDRVPEPVGVEPVHLAPVRSAPTSRTIASKAAKYRAYGAAP